jgi:cysteine-rich repeat protein
MCGDGMKDATEECDDGNLTQGDRCSPMCVVEHPEICPGTTIHLVKGQPVTIMDDTTGASDKFDDAPSGKGNCVDIGGPYPGPDLIYAVIPDSDGMLTARLDATYDDLYVHVRTACPGSKSDEIACQYRDNPGATQTTFPVKANITYFVAADGYNNDFGAFTLELTLQ